MRTDAQSTLQEEHELLQNGRIGNLLTTVPSWAASALLHLIILLIFCQVQWNLREPEKPKNTVVDLTERIDPIKEEQQEIQKPDPVITDVPVDVPIEDMVQVEMPEEITPDLGDPTEEFDSPEEPLKSLELIALEQNGPPRHAGTVFDGRTGKGIRGILIIVKDGRQINEATEKALGWLARVQEPDGHWDAAKWGAGQNCDGGVTGLALLAFLGRGITDVSGGTSETERHYRKTVRKALEWLEDRQKSNGSFGERFYTQGICTMATAEAYGMTRNQRWGKVAQKAIDFCCENQNPNGGWDYNGANPQRIDTSVSGWVVMGLKSGVAGGLDVPREAIARIDNWLKESINADGTTGYTKNIGAQGSSNGTPPMTAVTTTCRMFMGIERDDRNISLAMDYLHQKGVNVKNLYHTYYGTMAMHEGRRAYREYWHQWDDTFRPALLKSQVRDGTEFNGSWSPDVTWGKQGGRVYSTAMAVLCLEVYYRYLTLQKNSI